MPTADEIRQRYCDTVVVPLVTGADLEPLTTTPDPLRTGSIAALVNDSWNQRNGGGWWKPLRLFYCDRNGSIGEVYSLSASFDFKTGQVQLEEAQMNCIMWLLRGNDSVQWRNPLSGNVYRKFPAVGQAVDKLLVNSWHLFCGGILPMLRNESYTFLEDHELMNFQVVMLHHLRRLYEGTR